MSKILIIGGGAMGSAFSIPCLENNNLVKFIRDLPSSMNSPHPIPINKLFS